jgi:hypothetical protein
VNLDSIEPNKLNGHFAATEEEEPNEAVSATALAGILPSSTSLSDGGNVTTIRRRQAPIWHKHKTTIVPARPQGLTTSKPADWHGYSTIAEALWHYEQVIPNWLPASGVTVFTAEKGSGKTLTVLDQGLSLATDQDDWQGYNIEQGRFVVYLAGESQELTTAHAMAWCKLHDVDPSDG